VKIASLRGAQRRCHLRRRRAAGDQLAQVRGDGVLGDVAGHGQPCGEGGVRGGVAASTAGELVGAQQAACFGAEPGKVGVGHIGRPPIAGRSGDGAAGGGGACPGLPVRRTRRGAPR